MPTSVYFSPGVRTEQLLYEDLVIESLKLYGQETYYIPRKIVNLDNIFNEDIASKFEDSYMIEMYIEDIDGFQGQQTIMSKFGLQIRDQVTFVVARRRWEQYVDINKDTIVGGRPNEGDLIWLPLTNALFEIKFVEHQQPFYQLNNLTVYKLQCEIFEMGSEEFDTKIPGVDAFENTWAFSQTLITDVGTNTPMVSENVRMAIAYDTANEPIYVYGSIAEVTAITDTANEIVNYRLRINNVHTDTSEVSNFVVDSILECMTSLAQLNVIEVLDPMTLENDPSAQNIAFEQKAANIIDFSETNPFGESN